MGLLKPNQVLNKAYRQVAIETTDFDLFKNALRTLRDNIVDGQREHTQKILIWLSDWIKLSSPI